MEQMGLSIYAKWGLSFLVFAFSVLVAHWPVKGFRDYLKKNVRATYPESKFPAERTGFISTHSFIMGSLERLFFTIVIALGVSGGAVAMISWLFVKMATSLNRIFIPQDDDEGQRVWALSSLMAGLLSLFFALAGGLIIKWIISGRIIGTN